MRLRKFYYHFRVALSSWAGEMEVEGRETYTNCITIEDFMIQINETHTAFMLTSFRSFLKCQLLRGLPWPLVLKIILPSPYFLILPPPPPLYSTALSLSNGLLRILLIMSLLECQLQVRGFVWCCIPNVCAMYQVLKKRLNQWKRGKEVHFR